MTVDELEGFRSRMVPGSVYAPAVDALLAIAEWRNAVCSTQYDQHADSEHCNGENHVESCPVEVARQGLISIDDKREAL